MKNPLKLITFFFVSFALMGGDLPYSLGWKSSAHGIHAIPIEAHPLFRAAPLPATASVAQGFFKTNQKDRGACVAFSTWEAASAAHAKQNNGAPLILSPLDIYQQCLVADGSFPNDNGTYGMTAINVMLKSGALLEKTWPYSNLLDKLPVRSKANDSQRAGNMALKAYAVPNDDKGYAVKQCIANLKIAVMVGTLWYQNGFNLALAKVTTKDTAGKIIVVPRYVLPMPKGKPVGGHEIPIIEYDDNMKFPDGNIGGVRFHNHWQNANGSPWGDSIGSAWAPYAWFFSTKYVEDKCAIEVVK